MLFESITDENVRRLIAAGLLVAAVVVSAALLAGVRMVARRLERGTRRGLAAQVVRAVGRPGALLVGVGGVFLGLIVVPDLAGVRDQIGRTWAVFAILLVAQGSVNVVRAAVGWYLVNVAPRTETKFDDSMLPLLRRMLVIVIYGIAFLVILDALEFSISPILGGLGITGIAVALALQPTLSNFFAGTYVLSEGAINVGDFIELDGGPSGYVLDVGWRSTKIRTWQSNLVIIPNSVMADHVITNYNRPTKNMGVMVTCGVSYSSDLAEVERIAMEVGEEVVEEVSAAVNNTRPFFGFSTFGDSNIDFWLFLQAEDRWGSFVVTNELVKRLHARFKVEGIEINYPVRKIVYEDGAPPGGPALQAQAAS
ncbi:MAG: mechanosensitive ion channel family protein [Chloroflexi bacterium]|nr:mechanosensitive ion channel family protein [Chloroflexota bacterium]